MLDVFQKRELPGIAGAQDAGKDLGVDFGQAGPWTRGRIGREFVLAGAAGRWLSQRVLAHIRSLTLNEAASELRQR